MKNKFFAACIAVIMMLGIMPLSAFADTTLAFEAESITADLKAGDEIRVPIKATSNCGFAAGLLECSWDSKALELTDVEYNDELAPANNAAKAANKGKYKFSFGDDFATENFTGTGTFFTLVFSISSTASAGDYEVVLSKADVQNVDIEDVATTLKNGTVTLNGSASEDTLSFEVKSAQAELKAGEEVSVEINATSNIGYGSGILNCSWDKNALILKKVEYNSELAPASNAASAKNTGSYKFSFGDDFATENYTGTGTFFTLVF